MNKGSPLKRGKARIHGGVAQLGEHLPCKQGVKSSNLSISICAGRRKPERTATYLENRILNRSEIRSNDLVKTSENKQKTQPAGVTLYTEQRLVKLERAQGGCLGTKSRRKT